ncbi:GspH/FimT family pseudopilin [Rhodoferax sp. PAMC 29310]|uniref:GspH/FimT family pseudopilin n=1 Tax=Rhodoferax sp. PAMC 29310 TaxID=2822760 RepID=UPI001B328D40|nr:GspH/FimT family pseudopilin [Rhodoferax sp. PAMC 29310]
MTTRRSHIKGFTLIELMVTLALAAILMMVAVPSFTAYQRNSELTSFANTLLASVNAARGEAMKRGMNAMVVPAVGTDWDGGWVVFVDVNRNQAYDAAQDIAIFSGDAKPSYFTISGNGTTSGTAPYVMYDASGYSKTTSGGFGASTFEIKRNDVSGTAQWAEIRRLKIASTGRARICTPKNSTDSECSASSTAF